MSRAADRRSVAARNPGKPRAARFQGKRLGFRVFTKPPAGGVRAENRARRRAARTVQKRQRKAAKR